MRQKFHTRLAALFCAAALLITACPMGHAEEEAATQTVTVSSVTVEQGNSCTVTVEGSNFESMAALSLLIAYDTNALTVTGTSTYSMDYPSVNTNIAGFVQYGGASANGLSGNNTLLTITFRVNEDAEAREYPISVWVTEAVALVDDVETNVTVTGQAGSVTVREPSAPTVYFYSRLSSSTIESGDTVSMTVYTGNAQGMAAGQFGFEYDSDLFEFVSLELLTAMDKAGCVCTVNSKNAGVAVMSYLANEAVAGDDLMMLTLKAKEGVSGTTKITFSPNSLYDMEENTLSFSNSATESVTVVQKAQEEVLPRVWVELPEQLTTDKSFVAEFWVEGNSGLAAADFTLSYDSSKLTCVGVTSALTNGDDSIAAGGHVEIKESWENGVIQFSYMNGNGMTADTKLISAEFRAVENIATEFALVPGTVSGSDPVDSSVEAIELEYVTANGTILVPYFAVVFKNWDGTVLSEQSVAYLSAATAPSDPERAYTDTVHYTFTGWDGSFSSVTADLTVTAQYTEASHVMSGWANADGTTHKTVCTGCNYTVTANHSWDNWTKADESNHISTCTVCSVTVTAQHNFGIWTDNKNGAHSKACKDCDYTETTNHVFGDYSDNGDGTHTHICKECNATETRTHTFGDWSDCEDGTHKHSCTGCEASESVKHSFGNWIDDGNGEHYRNCTDCNAKESKTHMFDAWSNNGDGTHTHSCTLCSAFETANHTYGVWKDNGDGTGTRTCSLCGAEETSEHIWGDWEDNTNGAHIRQCKACGTTESENHEWGKWADDGNESHQHTCTKCSARESEAHDYGSWTDNGDGTHFRVCTGCNAKETSDHDYGEWTDRGNGTHFHICADCGEKENGTHTYDAWIDLGNGTHKHVCTSCSAEEMADHNFDTWVAAEDGIHHQRQCSECKAVETANHKWNEWVVGEDGSSHSRECSVCHVEEKDSHEYTNGLCNVCKVDSSSVIWQNGQLTIEIPGLVQNGMILTAFYTADDQLIACYISEAGIEGQLKYVTEEISNVGRVCVFVVDGQRTPLRKEIPRDIGC